MVNAFLNAANKYRSDGHDRGGIILAHSVHGRSVVQRTTQTHHVNWPTKWMKSV